jgi:hypothetical protein
MNEPTVLQKSEAIENTDAPKNDGIYPPTIDPIKRNHQIKDFVDIR